MAELIRLWFSKPELGVQFPARDTYFSSFSLFSLGALVTLKAKSIFSFLQKHLRAREYQLKKLSLKYNFFLASNEIIDKEDQENKEKCWGLFSRFSKLRSSCVCSGEKEARSTEEVEDAESERKDNKDNVNIETDYQNVRLA